MSKTVTESLQLEGGKFRYVLRSIGLLWNKIMEFKKLAIKELAKKNICEGHLYLSVGERKFYVMKPGLFVDPEFVKKHATHNSTFDFQNVVNSEVKEKFKNQFRELKYLQFEKDLKGKCQQIIQYFHKIYTTDEHFLSFALACYEEFCQLPVDVQKKMHETDMHLFRKALYSSAFSVIAGMVNDFYHYLMLKDFYHLTFCLDLGLCESQYSYFVAEACNAENRAPGTGKEYLVSEKASSNEIETFLKHPERSFNKIKSLSILSFEELGQAALYQHELSNGKGFPRGLTKGQVSNWEAVIIFADSLFEILPEYTFDTSIIEHVLRFQNSKISELPVNRVYMKLAETFKFLEGSKETGS